MDKYTTGTYQKGSFCGGSDINLNIITCNDKISIPSIIQSCVSHWYHTYLLHIIMDITDSIILQNLYWTRIRKAFQKEVTNCDTCQRTKWSNIKDGELTAK